jgi:hypothetical protein
VISSANECGGRRPSSNPLPAARVALQHVVDSFIAGLLTDEAFAPQWSGGGDVSAIPFAAAWGEHFFRVGSWSIDGNAGTGR